MFVSDTEILSQLLNTYKHIKSMNLKADIYALILFLWTLLWFKRSERLSTL